MCSYSRTTLHFVRWSEITPAALLEAFSRYFLVWTNRWLDDGFEPVRTAWLARARERGLKGLNDRGGMIFEKGGKTRTRPLRRGLAVKIRRSEEHTSELQSLMRISYAVFCLKKKKKQE